MCKGFAIPVIINRSQYTTAQSVKAETEEEYDDDDDDDDDDDGPNVCLTSGESCRNSAPNKF
jgi:hypothetical protein